MEGRRVVPWALLLLLLPQAEGATTRGVRVLPPSAAETVQVSLSKGTPLFWSVTVTSPEFYEVVVSFFSEREGAPLYLLPPLRVHSRNGTLESPQTLTYTFRMENPANRVATVSFEISRRVSGEIPDPGAVGAPLALLLSALALSRRRHV